MNQVTNRAKQQHGQKTSTQTDYKLNSYIITGIYDPKSLFIDTTYDRYFYKRYINISEKREYFGYSYCQKPLNVTRLES